MRSKCANVDLGRKGQSLLGFVFGGGISAVPRNGIADLVFFLLRQLVPSDTILESVAIRLDRRPGYKVTVIAISINSLAVAWPGLASIY